MSCACPLPRARNPDPRKHHLCVKCDRDLPPQGKGGPDPARARQFLQGAERRAGLGGLGFCDEALDRLEIGAREYGDNFRERGLRALFLEVREEGHDLGGWMALADELAIDTLGDDGDRMLVVRDHAQRIAALGVVAQRIADEVLDLLSD